MTSVSTATGDEDLKTVEKSVVVSTSLETEALAFSKAHDVMLLASLKGPFLETEARGTRAPIDLVAVIDRSGSMSGEKLDLVLKTMNFVVEQLKESDQLCIIAYDTNVELTLPLTRMTSTNKKEAITKLASIKANTSTNLSGGLLEAINQIMKRTTKNEVVSIMLFTDGLANVGITKSPEIVQAVSVNLAKIDCACSIFTFGYGSDHDERMLKDVAEAGKGLYYFIENLDDIPKSFGDCLGGLISVVAQNITLKVEGVEGTVVKRLISKIKGADKVQGASVDINLGDIYSEENRDIVILLTIPAIDAAKTDFFPAVNLSANYFNVLTNGFESKTVTAYVRRPAETPSDQPINILLDRQRNRLTAAEALEKAGLVNKSDKDARAQCRKILEGAIQSIQQSASSGEKISQDLMQDMKNSIHELEDETIEYKAVQKKMMHKGGCHSRQRGHEAEFYDNTDKMEMKAKAKSVQSNGGGCG